MSHHITLSFITYIPLGDSFGRYFLASLLRRLFSALSIHQCTTAVALVTYLLMSDSDVCLLFVFVFSFVFVLWWLLSLSICHAVPVVSCYLSTTDSNGCAHTELNWPTNDQEVVGAHTELYLYLCFYLYLSLSNGNCCLWVSCYPSTTAPTLYSDQQMTRKSTMTIVMRSNTINMPTIDLNTTIFSKRILFSASSVWLAWRQSLFVRFISGQRFSVVQHGCSAQNYQLQIPKVMGIQCAKYSSVFLSLANNLFANIDSSPLISSNPKVEHFVHANS